MNRFGDAAYAMGELVAELGAAFLCSDLKVSLEPRPDHAAYIDSWLTVLKHDKRVIFTAASKDRLPLQASAQAARASGIKATTPLGVFVWVAVRRYGGQGKATRVDTQRVTDFDLF